ncbi:hypothetical protein ICW40_03190 [Actinotalea ferrariae]|uniref:hypothetical protein n=1 Tax=Actinotalea ferrariae TaxID=1386098 RepID=UPI001C8CA6A4|nr:hypothetical protein [Actinotalea ferrariae]MBX9243810.1 hypothetical protein [Actinotalea ferrariae]
MTTSALALAWVWPQVTERRVVLIDADPSGSGLLGGALAAGFATEAGVLALAGEVHTPSAADLLAHSVALDSDAARLVLPGVSDPVQARSLAALWAALPDLAVDLHHQSTDVIVDAGRLGHAEEPTSLLGEADVVGLALTPTVPAVVASAAAVRRLAALRSPRARPVPAVVGERRPYTAREVERALAVPVAMLAFDARSAEALNAGQSLTGRWERSLLLRSVRALAATLMAGLPAGVAP